jgi:hypothetical protein
MIRFKHIKKEATIMAELSLAEMQNFLNDFNFVRRQCWTKKNFKIASLLDGLNQTSVMDDQYYEKILYIDIRDFEGNLITCKNKLYLHSIVPLYRQGNEKINNYKQFADKFYSKAFGNTKTHF